MSERGSAVLLAVGGGIAAYKSAFLCSRLVQCGYDVRVAMTRSATEFVGAAALAALSGKPVAQKVFEGGRYPLGAHRAGSRRRLDGRGSSNCQFIGQVRHRHRRRFDQHTLFAGGGASSDRSGNERFDVEQAVGPTQCRSAARRRLPFCRSRIGLAQLPRQWGGKDERAR